MRASKGFSFDVPSRAKGNQVYVPELDRIVLKDTLSKRPFASLSTSKKAVITARILALVHELARKNIHVTKRDLFYTDVNLFEDQVCRCALSCFHPVFLFAKLRTWCFASMTRKLELKHRLF